MAGILIGIAPVTLPDGGFEDDLEEVAIDDVGLCLAGSRVAVDDMRAKRAGEGAVVSSMASIGFR